MKKAPTYIFIGIVIIIVAVVITVILLMRPRLTGTDPKNGAKNIDPPAAITLTFNQDMTAPSLSQADSNYLVISPYVAGQITVAGKKVVFTPDISFDYGQTYQLQFYSPTTTTGKVLKNSSISFTVKVLPAQQKSDKQTSFINTLPRITDQYSLDYVYNSNSFTVDISSGDEATIRAEVETLLKDNGFDLTTTKVDYYLQPAAGGVGGP